VDATRLREILERLDAALESSTELHIRGGAAVKPESRVATVPDRLVRPYPLLGFSPGERLAG